MAKSFNTIIAGRLAYITSNMAKLNTYIHETGMMIVNHAHQHGDCTMAQKLVMALPASMRREMLVLWFKTYTPIEVKNSDDWVAKMHKPGTKLYVDWNIEDAKNNPFYSLAEANKERPPLDLAGLLKMFTSLGDRVTKLIEDGKVPEELIEPAKAAAAKVSNIRIIPVFKKEHPEEEPLPVANAA